MRTIIGMTLAQLDAGTHRPDGNGTSVKCGNFRFVVANGRDYDDEIVSTHRTSRGAKQALKDGQVMWQWDSYLGTSGGFTIVRL